MKHSKKINTIHIRSSGRSGSTLLNILLDRYEQIFAGAELFRYRWLWTRNDEIKSANGVLINESDFWNKVKEGVSLTEPVPALDPAKYVASEIRDLFAMIRITSKKDIICDTSKSPSYNSIIYDPNYFDTFVVHLIRDGRAVVHSRKPSITQTVRISLMWSITNLLSKVPYARKQANVRVKYEDLAFHTEACLSSIQNELEAHFKIPLNRNDKSNTSQHAFSGNSMRNSFNGSIVYDSRYIDEMSTFRWWVCTLLMLPTLLLYRYPLRRSRVLHRYCN